MVKVSIIISVFNKIKELELILYSLIYQSFKDFEVIIADDGSSKEMDKFVINCKNKFDFPIIHIKQQNRGFRKNKILNKSILNSSTDYLIFIDGDCIPNKLFIEQHYINRRVNSVLCGRRIQLSKKLSELVTIENINNGTFEKDKYKLFIDSFKKKEKSSKHVEESLSINNKILRKLLDLKTVHILGCNFSISKDLMYKVNGFDENYKGPGIGEDTDLEYRLRLINAKFISVRNRAYVYHLFHIQTIEEKNNFDYFKKIQSEKIHFCKNGIIKK